METSTPRLFYKTILFSAIILIFSSMRAQEIEPIDVLTSEERSYKVRPFRLGIKVGVPNLLGGNLEYVTPLLGDKLAVNVDYSTIKSDWLLSEETEEVVDEEATRLDFAYFEGGLNYYLFRAGKGLYIGAGYSIINFDGETDLSQDGQSSGTIDVSHGSFNVKLGAKLGGLFYFRPEVGYSFSPMPQTVDYQVTTEDGSTETETFDFSERITTGEIFFKGLTANIGIGFAF